MHLDAVWGGWNHVLAMVLMGGMNMHLLLLIWAVKIWLHVHVMIGIGGAMKTVHSLHGIALAHILPHKALLVPH